MWLNICEGPIFEPHVTLLGSIIDTPEAETVIKKTKELATKIKHPYRISFKDFVTGPHYFRCVMAAMEPTTEVRIPYQIQMHQQFNSHLPFDQVVNAYTQARAVFADAHGDEVYFPHISLIYADLSEEDKQQYVKELKEHYSHLPALLSWEVKTIHIWHTEGDASTWKEVAVISMPQD